MSSNRGLPKSQVAETTSYVVDFKIGLPPEYVHLLSCTLIPKGTKPDELPPGSPGLLA